MENKILLFVILFITNSTAQVIISPYIIYTDTKNKFGTFTVQNESNQIYEISISFIFGYPVTDSVGNATMQYVENPDSSFPSITDWIRAYPKKFILNPKQRQVIRMTVRPPADIKPGTYWSRIITSAAPQSQPVDTLSEGVHAQIKFVLNQITTFLYRIDPTSTGIEVKNLYTEIDSSNLNILANLERTGNSPFFGTIKATIFNLQSEVITQDELDISNYFALVKKIQIPLELLTTGEYKVELEIISNEKKDFPESALEPILPIKKYLNFTIP
jgi:P pilus assembly chaperone PapD